MFVSPEYFSVLGVDIVRGRGFTADRAERKRRGGGRLGKRRAPALAGSRRARTGPRARAGPDRGAPPPDEPPLLSRSFDVVGIARDVPGFRFVSSNQAVVYVPIGRRRCSDIAHRSCPRRSRARAPRARRALAAIDPNTSEITTLRTITFMVAYVLRIASG
jgi:hypothetical protein